MQLIRHLVAHIVGSIKPCGVQLYCVSRLTLDAPTRLAPVSPCYSTCCASQPLRKLSWEIANPLIISLSLHFDVYLSLSLSFSLPVLSDWGLKKK
jgi:hypothetical protein